MQYHNVELETVPEAMDYTFDEFNRHVYLLARLYHVYGFDGFLALFEIDIVKDNEGKEYYHIEPVFRFIPVHHYKYDFSKTSGVNIEPTKDVHYPIFEKPVEYSSIIKLGDYALPVSGGKKIVINYYLISEMNENIAAQVAALIIDALFRSFHLGYLMEI